MKKGKTLPSGELKDMMLNSLVAKGILDSELGEALLLQMFGGVSRRIGDFRLRGSLNIGVINPGLPLRCFLRSLADRLAMCMFNDLGRGLLAPDEYELSHLNIPVDGITIVDGIADEPSIDFAIKMARELSLPDAGGDETSLLIIIDTFDLEGYEYGEGLGFMGIPSALLKHFDYIHIGEAENVPRLADGFFRMYSERDPDEQEPVLGDSDLDRLEEYVFRSQYSLEPRISERLLRKVRRSIIHMSNSESGEHRGFCRPSHFGSIVRFAEAGARMRHSPEVNDGDVEKAIALVKGWLSKFDECPEHELRRKLRIGGGGHSPLQRIEPRYRLGDVILPEEVKSDILTAIAEVRCRETIYEKWGASETLERHSGTSILLTGPSGTGKTMTAEAIASHLGRKLLAVSLAGLTSCYIGETMRNVQRVFEAAEKGDVLLFDEADALFSNRIPVFDSTDALLNRDTSFLLSMIENQKGVTILTSNLPMNMDMGLERRIDTVIHFPRPPPEQQAEIFSRLMPGGAPVERIDYQRIAAKYPLCGGSIVNVVKRLLRTAALRESLNMDPTIRPHDVERVARTEFRKSDDMGCVPAEEVPGYS
ncbi:MAG: AAA family ATPase [Thermoplasmata archaeon]